MGGFVPALTSPLPVLKTKIRHYHRVVSSDCEKGPRDGNKIREGTMRTKTKVLGQEAAAGLISLIEPDG